MAMVGNDLGDAIKAAIDAVSDKTDRQALFRALGSAIVTYIAAHADFNGTITGADPQGGTVTGTSQGVGPGAVF